MLRKLQQHPLLAGTGEVLLDVKAAGVNPVDWKVAARRQGIAVMLTPTGPVPTWATASKKGDVDRPSTRLCAYTGPRAESTPSTGDGCGTA
mgnify:CR=1 FL=1